MKRSVRLKDMKEKQNENGYGRRGSKGEKLRMLSISMTNVSKNGSIGKGRKRNKGSMRRRGRKKGNARGRKR